MKYYVYIYLNILKSGKYIFNDLEFEYEPFYVGKGKSNRYLHHLNKVKNNCKYKRNMKFEIIEDIVKNGLDPIIIKFREKMSENEALILEKEIIQKIGRANLNAGPLANLNDGGLKPQDNYHHTDEVKNKISISGKNREPEKRYTLISPNGDVHQNVKLKNFCLEHNLDYQKMRKSSNKGRIKPIKPNSINQSKLETINCVGWSVINKKIIKPNNRKIKYKLISPNNEEFIIYSDEISKKIIEDLNLDFRLLRLYRNRGKIQIRNFEQCIKQESKNCQGWQFIDLKRNQFEFESNRKISWKITSTDGEVYLVKNLKEFCDKNNLSERTFRTFKNKGVINMNIRKNYNERVKKSIGWKCESI